MFRHAFFKGNKFQKMNAFKHTTSTTTTILENFRKELSVDYSSSTPFFFFFFFFGICFTHKFTISIINRSLVTSCEKILKNFQEILCKKCNESVLHEYRLALDEFPLQKKKTFIEVIKVYSKKSSRICWRLL